MNDTNVVRASEQEEQLVRDIIAQQEAEKLTDSGFAQKLNVPRSTWQAIKTRRRHINNDLIAAIMDCYGDKFDEQILAFHKGNCPTGK